MDEKREYVKDQISILLQYWMNKILVLGAILFLLLGILDYFFTPKFFTQFLIYRVAIALALLFLHILNQGRRNGAYQHMIIFTGTALSALTVEAMIMALGGHRSPYYAGLNLLIVCVLGFLPFGLTASMFGMVLIYLIYMVPILLLDTITDIPTFVLNNAFLLSTLLVALTLRWHGQKATIREIELQYDLGEEKKKIERQAELLDELVKERTEELRSSNQKFQELFDNANDGIIVSDRNGIILNANNKLCSMYGHDKDSLIDAHIQVIEDGNNSSAFQERMKQLLTGKALVFEAEYVSKDGLKLLVEISARAIEIDHQIVIQSFHRDITDKKRLQEQLLQSQKMESLGILAGGLAHDFNNILSQIIGYAELIGDEEEISPSIHSRALIIGKAAIKANVIVTKLLSFARTSAVEMKPIDLNHSVKDTLELLERMLAKKNVKVSIHTDESVPRIQGDINQLEQVLVNLLVNASDAMSEGGFITIMTSAAVIDSQAAGSLLLEPGGYAIIRIQDTGTGIPAEIRDRIFDPFFTTKELGKGTGLGLAMVYGIVKAHGGAVELHSEMGKGTTFSLYFPLLDDADSLDDDILSFFRNKNEG